MEVDEPFGSVTNWIEVDEQQYRDQVKLDFEKDFCQHPDKYDYDYSKEWHYRNFSCGEVTKRNRYWKEGENVMYIPLSFAETRERLRPLPTGSAPGQPDACAGINEPCGTGWREVKSACECTEEANWFIAGSQALSINLEHYYELIRKTTGGVASRQHSGNSCSDGQWMCDNQGSKAELKTLVIATAGKVKTKLPVVFTSPSPIRLPLGEVMRAAGVSMDDLNKDTLDNAISCRSRRADPATCRDDVVLNPLLRMTGAEIRFDLKYYNSKFRPDYPELEGHEGPVCIIDIQVSPKWASRPNIFDCAQPRTMSSLESDCTGRYYYGIVVSFRTEGRFGYFDTVRLLLSIGATLSYFRLPMWIVYFISLYCLGPLSSFYCNSLCESLKVDEALVRFVCHTMVSASSFRQMVGDKGTLSKEQLLRELHNVFHTMPEFDLNELAMLAELVWDRLSRQPRDEGGTSKTADLSPSRSTRRRARAGAGTHEQGRTSSASQRAAVRQPTGLASRSSSRQGLRSQWKRCRPSRRSSVAGATPSGPSFRSGDEGLCEIQAPDFVQSMVSRRVKEGLAHMFENKRRKTPLEWVFLPRQQFKAKKRFARNSKGSFDMDNLLGTISRSDLDGTPRDVSDCASPPPKSPRGRAPLCDRVRPLDLELVMLEASPAAKGKDSARRSPGRPSSDADGERSRSHRPSSECDVADERRHPVDGDTCSTATPATASPTPIGARFTL